MALKRFYFSQWVAGIQGEMSENDDTINMLQQRQAYNRIRRSFVAWRHHLHATFIARFVSNLYNSLLLFYFFNYLILVVMGSLMVQWVVGSILHGGPIELFLVPASAPQLV